MHRIELAADLEEPTGEQEWEAGWFVHENGLSWPAYSFNESLRLERPASAGRTLCAFVTSEDAVRGILCDHVRSLESDLDLAVESLPGCIDALRSVATGLARYGDGVALVTDARTLVDYLSFPQDPAYGKSK
ncbi:MAG: hypothetical protein GWO02_07710 [Gammaproteobacteria bacterium]|nr:hypothetical protein [Gammaproteobacteria bacterium]